MRFYMSDMLSNVARGLFSDNPKDVIDTSLTSSLVLGGGYVACAALIKTFTFACYKVGLESLSNRLAMASGATFPVLNTIVWIGCVALLGLPPIVHSCKRNWQELKLEMTNQKLYPHNAASTYLTRSAAATLVYGTAITIAQICSFACNTVGFSNLANRVAFPILTNNIFLPVAVIVVLPAVSILIELIRKYRFIIDLSVEQNIKQITHEICEENAITETPKKKEVTDSVEKVITAIYTKKSSVEYLLNDDAHVVSSIVEKLRIRFKNTVFEQENTGTGITVSWLKPPVLRKTDPEDAQIKAISDILKLNSSATARLKPSETQYDDRNALLDRLHEAHPDYLFFAVEGKENEKAIITFAWQKIAAAKETKEIKALCYETKTKLSNDFVTVEQARLAKSRGKIKVNDANQLLTYYRLMFNTENAVKEGDHNKEVTIDSSQSVSVKTPWTE